MRHFEGNQRVTPLHLAVSAETGHFFRLCLVSALLTIITGGIYYFWALVKVRAYLWSHTQLLDESFGYHGTGREMALGFVKLCVLAVPMGFAVTQLPEIAAALFVYATIFLALPYILYSARRYVMSRTSWRGLRFSFRGRLSDCYSLCCKGGLLMLVTLGFYYPYFKVRLLRYWHKHTYYGDAPFHYDGEGSELFAHYLRGCFYGIVFVALGAALAIFVLPNLMTWTMGYQYLPFAIMIAVQLFFFGAMFCLTCWWNTTEQLYHWQHTQFDAVPMHADWTWKNLAVMRLQHCLAIVLSLGFAYPWVKIDKLRFVAQHLFLLDRPTVERHAMTPPPGAPPRGAHNAIADQVADALDVGIDIGI